jgi:hypothetical protein
MAKVFIGAAAGFAGDRSDAGVPIVDALAAQSGPRFLMYETLAERTLALCQLERRQNPQRGYSPALDRMLPPVLARSCGRHQDHWQFRRGQSGSSRAPR